jgi:CheY-like chemotaxis protein
MSDQVSELPLQVLAVCDDAQVLSSASDAVRTCQGRLTSVPSAEMARLYVGAGRVDGIIIDADLADSLDLIRRIRSTKCNQDSTIFACVDQDTQGASLLAAGASFVFHKPLVPETLVLALRAVNIMMSERRRQRRFEVTTPVNLICGRTHQKASMLNLSETGMGICSSEQVGPGETISFSFPLPNGPAIDGMGKIVWRGCTGAMGIRFESFSGTGSRDLAEWLAAKFPADE